MSHRLHDLKAYYQILGLEPDARPDDIKAAYRVRAKDLHPDHNNSRTAPEDFQRLTEAYGVLRDPRKREAYDDFCRRNPVPIPSGSGSGSGQTTMAPLGCSSCGKVTAQPRYIVFERVRSFILVSHRSPIEGVFCRDCADRTAVKASTATWLMGWWGIFGPPMALYALLVNLLGGRRPRADNARVLLHQARAFLFRGDRVMARALVDQAQHYTARKSLQAQEAEELAALIGPGERHLKDRWGLGGGVFLAQLLPLLALPLVAVSLVLAGLNLVGRSPSTVSADIGLRPATDGEIRYVVSDLLKVREKPGPQEPVTALLERFTTVKVVGTPSDPAWVKIQTPAGLTGYVATRYLYAGAGNEPKRRWCAEQQGQQPESGEILIRRISGELRLFVHNDTRRNAVVKLKSLGTNSTLMSFYVAAGADASIAAIPEGSFRIIYALGKGYSRGCGQFLSEQDVLALPNIFHLHPPVTRGGQIVVPELSLQSTDSATDPATVPKAVPLEAFLHDD